MPTDILRAIHHGVLHGIPYNSISQFYEYFEGITPELRYGLSCGFQALEVGRRLRLAGLDRVRFLIDGRHAAAVCEHEGQTYLFDPYLLHLDPINLSGLAETGKPGDFLAYPFASCRNGSRKPGVLRVRHVAHLGSVSLEYMRVNSVTCRYALSRYFRLSFASAIEEAPPSDAIRSMLYHPEQNSLSVRILCPSDGTVRDLVYPICYYHGDPEVLASRLVARTPSGEWVEAIDEVRFEGELRTMASTLGVAPKELVGFVLRGVEIYERHAPTSIPYKPYKDYRPRSMGAERTSEEHA